MEVYYRCTSKVEYIEVARILERYLKKPLYASETPEIFADRWFSEYPVIGYNHQYITAWPEGKEPNVETLAGLLNLIAPLKEITVVLNAEYNAIVSAAGIKVGCQTFPLKVAKELYDATNKIKG